MQGLAQTVNIITLLQAFHPVLFDMSTSTTWRVKECSIKFIVFLAEKGGIEAFSQENQDIKKFLGQYLLDDFFSVRNCAIKALKE